MFIIGQDTKCNRLFKKDVGANWIKGVRSYTSRTDEFVLHSRKLFFVCKATGEIKPGPSVAMPKGKHRFVSAQYTDEGMIFLIEKVVPDDRRVFMISRPKVVERSDDRVTGLAWRTVFLDPSLGSDWANIRPDVQITKKYLFLWCRKMCMNLLQFMLLDHSGTVVVPLMVSSEFPYFRRATPTLDTDYFVSARGIFDLLQNGDCVLSTDPAKTMAHAISESYICLITCDRDQGAWKEDFDVASRIQIWNKAQRRIERTIELEDFCPANIVILADRVALALSRANEEKLCVIDLKTKKFRIRSFEDASYNRKQIIGKYRRIALSNSQYSSWFNGWEDIQLRSNTFGISIY